MLPQKKLSKKGNITLDTLPTLLLTLVVIATLAVAIYLTLNGLGNAIPDSDKNASTTEQGTLAVGNFTASINNIVAFAPTWGTVLGVAILVGIIIVAFAFGRKQL